MDLFLQCLFGLVAGALSLMTLKTMAAIGSARRLPAANLLSKPDPKRGGEPEPPPRVSIVIAARDEEARIELTVRKLLAQEGIDLEIIAVDDRSKDRTWAILRQLAAEDARVKPMQVAELPPGWLGKCHACHCGAAEATGEWILFTDADVWLKRDTLKRALLVARADQVDHICLTPGVNPRSSTAKAWYLLFLVTLADWFARVNRDHPKGFFGMGAFNLVRADAYRDCGGYEALRLTVVDDVKLGLLLRRTGKRTRAFIGGDDCECHWGDTAMAMARIMEKNYFAAIDYKTAHAYAVGVFGVLGFAAAVIGPFAGTWAGLAAFAALMSLAVPCGIFANRLNWGMKPALLAPFVFPLLFWAVLNSTRKTLKQGGIRWRDTFYTLESLRAGNVE